MDGSRKFLLRGHGLVGPCCRCLLFLAAGRLGPMFARFFVCWRAGLIDANPAGIFNSRSIVVEEPGGKPESGWMFLCLNPAADFHGADINEYVSGVGGAVGVAHTEGVSLGSGLAGSRLWCPGCAVDSTTG